MSDLNGTPAAKPPFSTIDVLFTDTVEQLLDEFRMRMENQHDWSGTLRLEIKVQQGICESSTVTSETRKKRISERKQR